MESVYYIDDEDFGDLIAQIEKSFGVEFEFEEIQNNITIDAFCELVISKMNMEQGQECTTQIVFYKIRETLTKKLGIERSSITPQTALETILPKKNRIADWKRLFGELHYDGIELQPPLVPYTMSVLTSVVSFFFMFGPYKIYAIPLFLGSLFLTKMLIINGERFPARTIGELITKIVKHNYKSVRTEKGTINSTEIKKILFHHLTDCLQATEVKNMNLNTKINYVD